MSARNPRAGVTLLETLIGLLVMSMVAALLSAAFGTNLRLLDRSQVASASVDQALGRRDLRVWLEHALVSPVPSDRRTILSGTSEGLRFLSVPPGDLFWPGNATEVILGPAASASGTGTASDGRTERATVLAVAPEGAKLTLSYWGKAAPDLPARWHDSWSPSQGLPDLIRIAFQGEGPLPAPMAVQPGKAWRQSEMSLSSLVPPALPSRP